MIDTYLVRVIREDGKKCWCTFSKQSVEYHDPKETESEVREKLTERAGQDVHLIKLRGPRQFANMNNFRNDVFAHPEPFMMNKQRSKK